jgi:hypothetical protein
VFEGRRCGQGGGCGGRRR